MKLYLFIVAVLLLYSCQKKVESAGIVYSKHHFPVPNVTVFLSEYTSGKDAPLDSYSTTTDNSGRFTFNLRTAKNRYFSLGVECDSGWTHKDHLSRADLKKIDLQLY